MSDSGTPRKTGRIGWAELKEMTAARVALGRHGAGLPTRALQAFALDHARAREAVLSDIDADEIAGRLALLGLPVETVHSRAADRAGYVRRPDLGRRLDHASAERLGSHACGSDVAVVIADGLSSTAVGLNAVPLVQALKPRLDERGLSLAPLVVARQARVALGDEIAAALLVRVVVVVIGERPGLSSADSLGAYVTYNPAPGTPDSRRNCISNIREGGLDIDRAANIIAEVVERALRSKRSGVSLSGPADAPAIDRE